MNQDIYSYIYFIYGGWKIGKSTFGAHVPNALFLALEPGHKFLPVTPQTVSTWEEFKDELRKLYEAKERKMIIIDPVDYAFDMCTDAICREHDKKHLTDLKYGLGYALAKEEFRRPFFHMIHSGCGVMFICHEDERTVESDNVVKHFYRPMMRPMVQEIILPFCDVIGRMYVKKEMVGTEMRPQRYITFAPSEDVVAGDRSEILEKASPIKVEPRDGGWKQIEKIFGKAFNDGAKRVSAKKTDGAAGGDKPSPEKS